jgi:2-hydroxychromene-2-carboxylate isomerase
MRHLSRNRDKSYGAGMGNTASGHARAGDRPESVDFHFDVMCPYAYQTSLWIREVRDRSGLQVNWRFFSLEEINRAEGKKHPWEREWSYGWSMMRIGALLRRQGMDQLDAWYATAGRALHVHGRKPHRPDVAREILAEMGHDPGLVDAAIGDPTTSDEVMAEHERVVSAGGFGVPTLFFPDGQCLFGPVLIDPPAGEEAERLWDLVVAWIAFPHLYELQRPKSGQDLREIATAFRPYLQGRDWVSVNRGAVVDFGGQQRGIGAPPPRADGQWEDS